MKRNMSRVGYLEAEDPLEWRKEKHRETSIQRFCVRCGDFKQFVYKSKTAKWIYLSCTACKETVRINRV